MPRCVYHRVLNEDSVMTWASVASYRSLACEPRIDGSTAIEQHMTAWVTSSEGILVTGHAGVVQKLPTHSWSEQDMESVLSRAYMWRASFNNARSHLTQG